MELGGNDDGVTYTGASVYLGAADCRVCLAQYMCNLISDLLLGRSISILPSTVILDSKVHLVCLDTRY